MKNFKDPKWETFSKCYEEMLTYRLTRRLLEHTHNPWFWNGSDSDSDSAGRSPRPPGKNQVVAETSRDGAEPEPELEERTTTQQEQQNRTTEAIARLHIQDEEENASALHSAVHGNYEVLGERGLNNVMGWLQFILFLCDITSQAHSPMVRSRKHCRGKTRSREPATEPANGLHILSETKVVHRTEPQINVRLESKL